MAKINEDKRGLFVELWKHSVDGIGPQQISWLTINPGCFRGGHYHKNQYEYFILIEGECEVLINMSTTSSCLTKLKQFEIFTVPPEFQHTFFSKNGAKLIILSDKEFNEKEPDTYVY